MNRQTTPMDDFAPTKLSVGMAVGLLLCAGACGKSSGPKAGARFFAADERSRRGGIGCRHVGERGRDLDLRGRGQDRRQCHLLGRQPVSAMHLRGRDHGGFGVSWLRHASLRCIMMQGEA